MSFHSVVVVDLHGDILAHDDGWIAKKRVQDMEVLKKEGNGRGWRQENGQLSDWHDGLLGTEMSDVFETADAPERAALVAPGETLHRSQGVSLTNGRVTPTCGQQQQQNVTMNQGTNSSQLV